MSLHRKVTVGLTLTLALLWLVTSASAAKGPGELKTPTLQSPLERAESRDGRSLSDMRRVAEGMDLPDHARSDCYWLDYACNVTYMWELPDGYGDDFFNMRFTPEGACTLKTLEIALYDDYPEFSDTSGEGITLYVWDDDGFGLPLNVVHQVVVPGASLVYLPNTVSVDVYPENLIFAEDFHFGYTVNNQELDNIACVSDDGFCGSERSSLYHDGLWRSLLDSWGVDVNFLMFVEVCCPSSSAPGVCRWIDYSCGVGYYWTIPDDYGDDFFNMRFTPDSCCTLTQVQFRFYDNYPEFANSQGVEIYVWDDDGTGLPGSVVYSTTVPAAAMVYFPNYTSVDLSAYNLIFCDDFHVGYSTVDQVNDNIGILSDDGSCGVNRSSEYWSGIWGTMLNDWEVDVNFHIQARLCCPACYADGDCDGNSTPLSVADYAYLVDFVFNGGPAPIPHYSADLNGDCIIDSLDLVVFEDYFINGMPAFDPYGGYPVATCCHPPAGFPLKTRQVHELAEELVGSGDFQMEGWYTDNAERQLVADYWEYLQNVPTSPTNVLLLEGDTLPEADFGGLVRLTGHIDSLSENPYPHPDAPYLFYVHVTGYELIAKGAYVPYTPPQPLTPGLDDSRLEDRVPDPCKFAILLSGGIDLANNKARYWSLLEAYYTHLVNNDYDPNNIHVVYFDGMSDNTGLISHADVDYANAANVNAAFADIANDITNNCAGHQVSVFLWTFDHGQDNGEICLMGWEGINDPVGMSEAVYRNNVQSILNAGCDSLYVVMGQCFAGQQTLELKNVDINNRTTMYVVSNANETVTSISTRNDDPFLREMLAQLGAGNSFEVAMVEACSTYLEFLWDLDAAGHPVGGHLAARSIVWKRDRYHTYGDPGGQACFVNGNGKFEFLFHQGGSGTSIACGNTDIHVWQGGAWSRAAHWNWNIPGSAWYSAGNELRVLDVPLAGSGIYQVVSACGRPYTVTASSFSDRSQHWKGADGSPADSTDPSNIEEYAGFMIGWNDDSPEEFGEITSPFHSIENINLLGFNLSDMPQVLGPLGVIQLEASFPMLDNNIYWLNLELVLDVAEVIDPGLLYVTLPGDKSARVPLTIDHEGEYHVPIGVVPPEEIHYVQFNAPEANFSVDTWSLNSLVTMAPFVFGDADGNGIVNISDAVYLIAYIFAGGPAPIPIEAGDADCNGIVNVSDAVYLLAYIFGGGDPPCAQFQ